MDQHTPALIATIAVGLSLAFLLGMAARRLHLPTLVGYLAAGVLIGPYTIGYVADAEVAAELAQLGIVLLMFGTGIHFSIKDLLAVRSVAIPGAIGHRLLTTIVGIGVGIALGWGFVGGLVLGLAISVASTVVLLRALIERGELDSVQGRVAVGWLIVEDIVTVIILVLLPSAAPILTGVGGSFLEALGDLAYALLQASIFAAIMLFAGMRLAPRILDLVARERSRELFVLAVLALALGVSYLGYQVFGVSLALGGFLAGAVVSESDLSHQAAAEAQPLRDSFSVLFFVSVGMLVDPGWIITHPLPVLLVTAVVIGVKSVAAYGVVAGLGYPSRVGVTVGAALSQVGEFTFILVGLGVTLGRCHRMRSRSWSRRRSSPSASTRSCSARRSGHAVGGRCAAAAAPQPSRRRRHRGAGPPHPEEQLRNHAIVCGHGRVGRLVTSAIERRGFGYVVLTDDRHETARLRSVARPRCSATRPTPTCWPTPASPRRGCSSWPSATSTPHGSSWSARESWRRASPSSCARTTSRSGTRSWPWAGTSRPSWASSRSRSR